MTKHSGLDISPEAIQALGIHVDKTPRASVTVPPVAPGNIVEHLMHMSTRVYTFDMLTGSEKHAKKPIDVAGMVRYVCYNNPGELTPARSECSSPLPSAGHTVYDIVQPQDKHGMMYHLITAYENKRGELGQKVYH